MSFTAPEVRIGEQPPEIPTISGAAQSTFSVVGIFEKGPIGVPTFFAGPEDVKTKFGEPIAAGIGRIALDNYFQQGGKRGYAVRIVHFTNPADLATSTAVTSKVDVDDRIPNDGVFASALVEVNGNPTPWTNATGVIEVADNTAEAGDSFNVNGVVLAEGVDWNFGASLALTAASIISAINNSVDPLIDGIVSASVDPNNSARFIITALAAGAAGNALTLSASDQATTNFTVQAFGGGVDGDSVTVDGTELKFGVDVAVGATAAVTALNLSQAINAIASVTASINSNSTTAMTVRAAVVGTAGNAIAMSSVDGGGVLSVPGLLAGGTDPESDVAATIEAADGPGTHADGRVIRISPARNGLADHFRLDVISPVGAILDTFDDLNLNPTSENYAETRINDQSARLITFDDGESANIAGNNNLPALGSHLLAGGNDGLVGINDNDFIGSLADKTGIYSLRNIDEKFDLAGMPDRTSGIAQKAFQDFQVLQRHFLYLHDYPEGFANGQDVIAHKNNFALSSERAHTVWPGLIVRDTVAGAPASSRRYIGSSAYQAGLMAATDDKPGKGLSKAAAGTTDGRIAGGIELESNITDDLQVRGLLFAEGINSAFNANGIGPMVDGYRLSDLTGLVPNTNEARVFIFVGTTLKNGLAFAKNENIEDKLFRRIDAAASTFLRRFWKQGGLKGRTADEAFFIDSSSGPGSLNPPSQTDAGILKIKIGLATLKPAYFIEAILTVDQRQQLIELGLA